MLKKSILTLSLLSSTLAFAQISLSEVAANEKASVPPPEVILPSGVVVKISQNGTGSKPTSSSTVEVHYRGYFKNNQEFDSSYKRGQTISFPLGNVIPCWTQGMQQLTEGSKATLYCPSNTAYGSRGAPGAVPPNTDLYFDVELIKVK